MEKKQVTKKEIIIFFLISIVSVLFFWNYTFMSPLKYYTVAIHETWHALATFITGGTIVEIHLDKNGGYVKSSGGIFILIASAGYVGNAIISGFLIISSKSKGLSKKLLIFITGCVIALTVIYIDNYASSHFLMSLALSIAILILAVKTELSSHVAIFLATILAIDGVKDIKMYVMDIPTKTDAGILARYFGFEFLAIPIALTFALICLSAWYFSIVRVLKKEA